MLNTQSIFLSSWSHALLPSFYIYMQFVLFLMHSCRAFVYPRNLCGSSQPGTPSSPLTLFLRSSWRENCSFSGIPFRCYESSTVAPHPNLENLGIYLEAVIKRVWRCTWRPLSGEPRDSFRGCNRANSVAMILRTWWP